MTPVNVDSALRRLGLGLSVLLLSVSPPASASEDLAAENRIVAMLADDAPWHFVPASLFERLGWPLPDDGRTVENLADDSPGGALDPRSLEKIPAEVLGYRASWHEVRFRRYNLDWDIPGLALEPVNPLPDLPTLVIVNGGAANWYEFFLDPLNRPGIGQYLAQKVRVLLVTIPGNYRQGGWTEDDFASRVPAYLLDRNIPADEAALRNAVYTFGVVAQGTRAIIEEATEGPVVIVGHSTGGELQFLLHGSALEDRLQGLSLGWGTGGPAGSESMRAVRGIEEAGDYRHVTELRPRTCDQYAGGYLGPLNPFWDPAKSRLEMACDWMAREERRRPQFKQPLQDYEHRGANYLKDHVAAQIREALRGNELGIDPEEVIADLFSTMRVRLTGYERMIWTTARLDDGHWHPEQPERSREVMVSREFRRANPDIPVRLLVFDVPMTHYGHIERPRQLAGGLVAALRWLAGGRSRSDEDE